MSDDTKALVPGNQIELPEIVNDISDEGMKKVQAFVEAGLPGIARVDEIKMTKMTELYLSGKTYDQISNIMRIDKTTIMYLSQKLGWCEVRQTYLLELEENMKRRVVEAKLMSQDFMLQLVQAWQKKISKKVTKYLATDDEKHINEVDLKEIDRYVKIMESLKESIQAPKSDSKGPAVGLNLGDGVTVTRKGDNEIEITPKQNAVSDILQKYADMRRDEEKKK